MENLHMKALDSISTMVGEAASANIRAMATGTIVSAEQTQPFSLSDFQSAFEEIGQTILPDSLADQYLDGLKSEQYKLKNRFPAGAEYYLAAFPCDPNGRIYTPAEIASHAYFRILHLNPQSGLTWGYGAFEGPHHKMLPLEIQEQCRVQVRYQSQTSEVSDRDFEMFSSDFRTAFHNLQKLLANANPA
jgi:hypothetical protein